MSITHNINKTWSNSEGASLPAKVAITAEGETNLDPTIAGDTSNVLVGFACTRANMKSFWLLSDQPLTMKTNSTGGTDTFAIAANEPLMWDVLSLAPNIFSADVTALYFTSAVTPSANVKIRCARNF